MEISFKKIEIGDIGRMMPFYTMRRNNTCDSVFLESFIWKDFYNVRFAIWEDRALLWLMEYNGKCFSAMPLCREEDLPDAFHAIEQYFNEELGYPLVINLADEYAVNYLNLPENKYFVKEQVDSRDYLYKGEALRKLPGKKLHKKRNRVSAFKRQYDGRYEYRALRCIDSHYVWQFLDRWREGKGEDAEEHLDYEVRGIHDILKNCASLNVRMGGVFIDGELEAFTIGSYNPVENMAVIHIEKANPEINGLYQYINQEFLLAEFPEVEWVNREDDLGLEGLRIAKMSYDPADFARKYLVEQILDGRKGYKWAEEIGNTRAGEELVYLEGEEKQETRQLWHDCFPEDSERFIDYYYGEKVLDNQILVKKQNGLLAAMAQLNPYRVRIKKHVYNLAYIVGVATEETRRHRGYMREILTELLNRMREAGTPFTFLMPAAQEIYLPLGFALISDPMVYEFREGAEEKLSRRVCRDVQEDCERAAVFMESWLSGRFEVYCERDKDYVSRLIRELKSEDGKLEFLEEDETLAGLFAEWGLGKRERRLLCAGEDYTARISPEASGERPGIMARITNVEELLSVFSLRGGETREIVLELRVQDPLIEGNNGSFSWRLAPDGAEARRESSSLQGTVSAAGLQKDSEGSPCTVRDEDFIPAVWKAPDGVLEVKIEDLTSWLFGYVSPDELWPDAGQQLLQLLREIDTVKGVWIDEVV